MRLDFLRWILLAVALLALLFVVFGRPSRGRLALGAVSGLAWYGLSRRKTLSLDRERFAGGMLGRRP